MKDIIKGLLRNKIIYDKRNSNVKASENLINIQKREKEKTLQKFINKENKRKGSLYNNLKGNYTFKIMLFIIKYLTIIYSLSLITYIRCNQRMIQSQSSFIIMKLYTNSYSKIISDFFILRNYPKEIYINGINQSEIKNAYDFNNTNNTIKMIWNKQIDSTERLFYDCRNINEIDLSNFDTSIVTNMYCMFTRCYNLNFLNLSNINTSNVGYMQYMFGDCNNLNYLDLSNFDTSNVKYMINMFAGCYNLNFLNLSNFNTSNVGYMQYMFHKCYKLTYIDLSNFETSNVINMEYMFSYCSSLTSLNLSNFNTSKVITMGGMFEYCSNLTYIDLSNFDTSQVTTMGLMFQYCSSLKYLDLSNFNTSNVTSMGGMFQYCSSLTYLDLSNFDTSNVTTMGYMFYRCTSLTYLDLSKFNTSKVTTMLSMFEFCSELNFINLKNSIISDGTDTLRIFHFTKRNLLACSINIERLGILYNFKIIKCINNFNETIPELYCFSNSFLIYNKYTCNICGSNYHEKFNESYDNNSFINCYESLEGYFLYEDENISYYKPCYHSCKTCNQKGNDMENNCIECNNDYKYILNLNNSSDYNCYNNCLYNFYFDRNLNKSFCTIGQECPEPYNKIIFGKNECIDHCNNHPIYKYEFNNTCYNETQNNLISTEITTNSELINEINTTELITEINTTELMNEINTTELINEMNKTELITYLKDNLINKFDKLEIDNIRYKKIIDNNTIIVLSPTFNQNEYEIILDLKECDNILKNTYNISKNNSLYIFQLIVEEPGMKIPKVEYEIYYPFNIYNLTKLNLTYCKNQKIEIIIPVKINDTLDKHDQYSDYYNNICYKSTSNFGTDITLKDRKNEFMINNMTLCEEKCKLIDYNYNTEKVKCSCDIKLTIPFIDDIKFNKEELYKSFIDIKNIINLNVMKCYKISFNKDIINNYGFYILNFIIILYFICLIIFSVNSYDKLKDDIKEIYTALNMSKNEIKTKKIKIKVKKKVRKKKKKGAIINNNFFKSNNLNVIENKKIKNYFEINMNNKINMEITQSNEDKSKNKILESKKENNIINNINKEKNEILEYKDFELNILEYEDALESDNRNYIQLYISFLKNNHPIFFSFYNYKDYNSRIIKMFLFVFSFASNLIINAFFFTDETMHKIYSDKGEFNFIYQFPQILYSSLISGIISSITKRLALSQENIIQFKQKKDRTNIEDDLNELIKNLKFKFISFFIITFLILLFFWFYIICFCGIYVNTQIHLLKDTIISFITELIYPFGFYLIPGIFRINAIKSKKKYLYTFSNLLGTLLL